jgi:hypothetical protein
MRWLLKTVPQRWRSISQSHRTCNKQVMKRECHFECWNQNVVKAGKFKQSLSARKLMATVFWDRKGVLMVDFMQQETTITREGYCELLKNYVGPLRKKAWNADIRCTSYAPLWQCASAYSCCHSSPAGPFQLGVVWPHSLQAWSRCERLPLVYLPE